jgi:hypothetical protein
VVNCSAGFCEIIPCSAPAECPGQVACAGGFCQTGAVGGGNLPGYIDGVAVCESVSSSANTPPVDIIFVIDNSGSMTAEIGQVEANINNNFAAIIAAANLDYRVIMVSRHGSAATSQSICVSQPLSGTATCAPPPATPTNTANFFHYSVEIGSTNSFTQVLNSYDIADEHNLAPNGWRDWLRADAHKVFVEITDDNNTSMTYTAFDAALTDPSMGGMFGSAAARKYTFHSIVGIIAKANPADAYGPSEGPAGTPGVFTDKCPGDGSPNSGAVNHSPEHQQLSILTGGLRFPVCETNHYNTVFNTVAEGVVAQAACQFVIPPPPIAGFSLDKIQAVYTPGNGGAPHIFAQVADLAACTGNSAYRDATRVYLCPDACTMVRADEGAQVSIQFTCDDGGD